MRHHRGHLADRGQPIAQPLALLDLLDVRQVLEKQRRADRFAVIVANQRQRVADHGVGGLEPQLGAVGQRLQFKRAAEDADDIGMLVEHVGIRLPGDRSGRRQVEQPARFVVEQHEAALAVNGQHAIPHVPHHVAEEHVLRAGRSASLRVWPYGRAVAEPG